MKEEILSEIRNLWRNHPSSSLGVLLSFVLAVLVLIFGFWNILFVVICVGVGLYIGKKFDEGENVVANLIEYAKDKLGEKLKHEPQRRTRGDDI